MRIFVSIVIGAITTFGLFSFMAYLINNDQVLPPVLEPPITVTVAQLPEEKPPESKPKFVNNPPPPPKPMPRTVETATETTLGSDIVYEGPPRLDTGGNSDIVMTDHRGDGEARPIVRINPTYPIHAARDGIQGWVKLRFDITDLGAVTNVVVIDAEPKRIFNKAAKKALKKWKYRAKSANGKSLMTQGLTVQLDFNIDQQS